MKSRILEVLRNKDGSVSGQELCERFGVTRTAIWKAINQLKEEGYQIEAVQNKGYRIVGSPDTVAAPEILSLIKTKWAGRSVLYLESVDSTNNYAKKAAEAGAYHGTLVVAEYQNAGKGRRGKQWSMPCGSSVAMSLILRPGLEPVKASMLTLIMGMAVADAIQELTGIEAGIKWPNDIVIHKKKVCGILTEMSAEMEAIHYLVVGAGVNVNLDELPNEIQEVATSLSIETKKYYHRAELICGCMKWFEYYYECFVKTSDLSFLKKDYNARLVNYGNVVKVLDPGGEFTGVSEGIDDKGELLVRRADGTLTVVFAGEVSVRGYYGYV